MICQLCRYKVNCINGSWCSKFRVYVEYKYYGVCILFMNKYKLLSRILGVLKLAVIDFKSLDIVNDECGILAVAILEDGKELWWLDSGECFQIGRKFRVNESLWMRSRERMNYLDIEL